MYVALCTKTKVKACSINVYNTIWVLFRFVTFQTAMFVTRDLESELWIRDVWKRDAIRLGWMTEYTYIVTIDAKVKARIHAPTRTYARTHTRARTYTPHAYMHINTRITLFSDLSFLRKSQYFPFWMFSAKQGHYWYHFYNVFGMTRSLTGDWTRELPHSNH